MRSSASDCRRCRHTLDPQMIQLSLDGRRVSLVNRDGRVVKVHGDETILEAAEADGLVLPYGCRYGGCVTCAARLLSGSVDQPDAVGLKDYMAQAGYVLICVARPLADCELEVGVRSHFRGLHRNPFRSAARIQTGLLDPTASDRAVAQRVAPPPRRADQAAMPGSTTPERSSLVK